MRHSSFFSSAQAQRLSLLVKAQAVGPPAGLHEGGELAVHAPFHDAVVGLVGEEDVAGAIAGGAFGEREIAGQLLELGAWGDDVTLGCHGLGGAKDA